MLLRYIQDRIQEEFGGIVKVEGARTQSHKHLLLISINTNIEYYCVDVNKLCITVGTVDNHWELNKEQETHSLSVEDFKDLGIVDKLFDLIKNRHKKLFDKQK